MSSDQLTPALLDARARWLNASREERDLIYARDFLPTFIERFRGLPLEAAPPDMRRPRALVSVVGLSWQPVVLMAGWVRPQRLLLLATEESRKLRPGGEDLLAYLSRHAGVASAAIDLRQVPETGEVEIYREIRQFVASAAASPREVAVDPTGGKKSMSVAAGLAASQLGCPILYVDYREYDPTRRVPLPGTEYPRLLADPLVELGERDFEALKRSFNGGAFNEAAALARRLAERLYEPREAEAMHALAMGYAQWAIFDFGKASFWLDKASGLIANHGTRGGWSWAREVQRILEAHAPLVESLKAAANDPRVFEHGVQLVSNHVGAARRSLDCGMANQGLHLTYSSLERFVDLVLWTDFALDDDRRGDLIPVLPADFDLTQYHHLARCMFGSGYEERPPRGPVMFTSGCLLLATLRPGAITADELALLNELSTSRNATEFEHGLVARTAPLDKCEKWFKLALQIIRRHPRFGDLDPARYRFPKL